MSKDRKIGKKVNGLLMGAIIGGAIGSVIGMKMKPGKEPEKKPEKKKSFFGRLKRKPKQTNISDLVFQDEFQNEELKKIPHE